MSFTFDEKSLERFRTQKIESVTVRLVSGWCSGTKISVETGVSPELSDEAFTIGNLSVSVSKTDAERLSGGKIVGFEKNGKDAWILVSDAVRERCGCGTSFSFGIPTKKLGALKAFYAKKPNGKTPSDKS